MRRCRSALPASAFLILAALMPTPSAAEPAFNSAPSTPVWTEPEFRMNDAVTVWIPLEQELLLFRQAESGGPVQVWSSHRDSTLRWERLDVGGSSPTFVSDVMAAVYDPDQHRVLMVAPSVRQGEGELEVWSLMLTPATRWERVAVAGAGPEPRQYPSIALLARPARLLLFGGWATRQPPPPESRDRNDAWVLDLGADPSWRELAPTGTPPPAMRSAAFAADPAGDAAVLIGGNATQPANAWMLQIDPPRWSPLVSQGEAPTNSLFHGFAFDPKRSAYVAVSSGAEQVRVDLLRLGTSPRWDRLTTIDPPPACTGARADLDVVHDHVVLAGGRGAHGESLDRVWEVSLAAAAAWQDWTPDIRRPSARSFHAATYVSPLRSVAYFGGAIAGPLLGGADPVIDGDLWWLSPDDVSPWRGAAQPDLPGPGRLTNAALIHDERHARLVALVGGVADGDCYLCHNAWSYALNGVTGWQPIEITGPVPTFSLVSAYYDDRDQRALVVATTAYEDSVEVWSLPLDGPASWSRIVSATPAPGPRDGFVCAYDARVNRILLYGGDHLGVRFTETWALSLGNAPQWSRLDTGGGSVFWTPQAACFDPLRDRMLAFAWTSPVYLALEVYELALGGARTWTRLEPLGTPPPAIRAMPVTYDPRGDRVVVFGGSRFNSDGAPSVDRLWFLDLGSPIIPVEIALDRGSEHPVAEPTGRARIHVAVLSRADFDARSVDPATVVFQGAPAAQPPGRGQRAAQERDVDGDGLPDLALDFRSDQIDRGASPVVATLEGLTFDGRRIEGQMQLGRSQRGSLPPHPMDASEVPTDEMATSGISLSVWPNPTALELQVRVGLTDAGPVRLDLLDLAGRRIQSLDLADTPGSPHVHFLRLSPGVRSGLYWLKVSQAGRERLARVVILR
jgi:hypothetical protein